MPSITKSLEAMHGHLNETITKQNGFWHSLAIRTDSIADTTLTFDVALVHDFRTSLKRSKRRVDFVPDEQMREECAFFCTTIQACGCAETIHVSSMYHTGIPCSHRYVFGATKPRMPPEMRPVIRATTAGMEYSKTLHQRNRQLAIEAPHLRQYAVRGICRLSHSRDKGAMARYVDDSFDLRVRLRLTSRWRSIARSRGASGF
jgi:hypothetical protein